MKVNRADRRDELAVTGRERSSNERRGERTGGVIVREGHARSQGIIPVWGRVRKPIVSEETNKGSRGSIGSFVLRTTHLISNK